MSKTAWNKGKKETRPEVLEKLRKSHLGQIAWNKNKKETRMEVIDKLKKSHIGNSWGEHSKKYKKMMSILHSGKNNPMWKNGKINHVAGYIWIYKPKHPFNRNNYVLEHRLVMEKHLGRYLTRKEVVHHVNGIKNDNRLKNLMLFKNNTEHLYFHKSIDN